MAGVQRSFDAAKKALERVAEASQKPAIDPEKQEKKELKKVEDSKDKAALARVKDKEVKPRVLDKDAQHNSLSLGFGDTENNKPEGKSQDEERRTTKDQKVNKEWEKSAKRSSGTAQTKKKQEEFQKASNIQEDEFLISFYSDRDYYSLAIKDDPDLQKLEELYKSINESNSKEVNEKNYKIFDKQLEKYAFLLSTKDKKLAQNVVALLRYKLHEKVKSSPKLQAQGFEAKPLPPSMKPQAAIIEARAQSDDKYYSGLLTAIAGNTVYVNTVSYVQDSNSRMLELNAQAIEKIAQENEQAYKNRSGYETLIEDSIDDGVDSKKAKRVIEVASLGMINQKIEKEIKDTPKADSKKDSSAKSAIDQSMKGLKNIDLALRATLIPLNDQEPELKGILEKFRALKKGSKPEVNNQLINDIFVSLDKVDNSYAKELVLYSLKLKAEKIGLQSEVPRLESKLKELDKPKVDPKDILHRRWLHVSFVQNALHRIKDQKVIAQALDEIKKQFKKKFNEPDDKVNNLVNKEFQYFSDKYPKAIEV